MVRPRVAPPADVDIGPFDREEHDEAGYGDGCREGCREDVIVLSEGWKGVQVKSATDLGCEVLFTFACIFCFLTHLGPEGKESPADIYP
jgi:hypothetical protein